MLTIRFSVTDLARTRFAVSPMDHVLMAVAGGHPCVGVRRARWWRRVRGLVPHTAAPLLDLVAAGPTALPEFLIPAGAGPAGAGPAGAGPDRQLADELDQILAAGGDTRELRRLVDAAWSFFQACLAPDWPGIRDLLWADIARRTHAVAHAGIGAVLEQLHPHAAWHEDGALRWSTVDGQDQAVDLGGGGLELRPNFFVQDCLGAFAAHRRPAVLLHPTIAPPVGYLDEATRATDRLTRLIGPARARALRAVGQQPCTTSQLAARLGTSVSTASAHATALRTSGAITTHRHGREVRHTATPLGLLLLGNHPAANSAVV